MLMSDRESSKQTLTRDDLFRVVCEFLTPIPVENKARIGTGIFVYSEKGLWIITAKHVAKDTNDQTRIVIATNDGKANVQLLSVFGSLNNWNHHANADVSAFRINPSDDNRRLLEGRFFAYDQFNVENQVVSRDFELTSVGFPQGLGTNGSFSPFTFRSYASSGFVTLQDPKTKEIQDYFCMENPSVGGYSGGPVLDLGYSFNGVMRTVRGATVCHGIMHGTISDDTGGKIAAVTPGYYLKDIIE